VREVGDGADALPVAEAFAPAVGIRVDLLTRELVLNLGDRERSHLLAIDDEVPDGVAGRSGRRGGTIRLAAGVVEDTGLLLIEAGTGRCRGLRLGAAFGALHHDDVAALLALDLEDLASDLFVGNRVLRGAVVADDLHRGWPSLRVGVRAETSKTL
jgi:hypothetical protein